MSMITLRHDLLKELIEAKIEVAAYLALRRAKGYMSISETERLREHLFRLCTECRERLPALNATLGPHEKVALEQAAAALSAAAVSLMTGRHDCPRYIAIDADKLDGCLNRLSHSLNALLSARQTTEA